jgi:NADH-quinone oxidoreductase subunit F
MGRQLLLEKAKVEGILTYDVYRREGGYASVEKALKNMTPDQVTEEVKKSGLRGRGGAGFPTGLKWSFLAKPDGVPRHLVCNADESEPGTFKDRYLMEFLPHLLIEGLIVSSYALGSKATYIYIRGEYAWIPDILERAIDEAKANGWLGKNILGTGFDCEIYVHTGAGAYICGEETALIESLEGKRGNPRIKPPFPAVRGVWDRPTVVNNVETLAAVVPIINMGGEEYAKIGVGKSTGTKLLSACGNINKPGVYEIDMTISVEEFIYSDEYCGGIPNGKRLKACIPGGSSVPILPANLLLKTAKGETFGWRFCKGLHDGLRRIHRARRRPVRGEEHADAGAFLPSRKLRTVFALPGGNGLDGEDIEEYRQRERKEKRYRPALGYPAQDRREYHLPAGGCGGLAGCGGDTSLPRRVRMACR